MTSPASLVMYSGAVMNLILSVLLRLMMNMSSGEPYKAALYWKKRLSVVPLVLMLATSS